MTEKGTAEDTWAGQALRARREQHKLTQKLLAELAGIDRSRYIALERGRQRITLTYAERIAPHLGLTSPEPLLPPPAATVPAENPLDRLAALEAEVERLRERQLTFGEGVLERLAALEASQAQAAQQSDRQKTGGPAAD